MLNKVCYCDLDGVFSSYPKSWLEFISLKTGQYFNSLEEAKKNLVYAKYVSLKNDYRSSDFKYNLTPREGSSSFTKFLHEEGYFIVITTTRPLSYPQLLIRTIHWLEKNNILFDDIIFCEELEAVLKYPDLAFGVEDEPHVANRLARWGYKTFLMRNGRDIKNLHGNVIVVDCFKDIMEVIKDEKYKDENFYRK